MAHDAVTAVDSAVAWAEAAALGERMTSLAAAFAGSLDLAQQRRALHPFDGAARRNWGYTPRARPGLPLRAMSTGQRQATWALVDAVLSAEGAAKARGVLALEAMLQERTANKAFRDPENYALALFGQPGRGPWAWRFEGHHISLTLTVVPGIGIAVSPHFFGANPFSGEVVPAEHGGLARVLEQESALAFEVVNGLDPQQLRQALIAAEAPPDFLTGPGREHSLREPVGLTLDAMRSEQRNRTTALLETFFRHLEKSLAEAVTAKVRSAGLGAIHFAWAGGTTPDRLHYYRLHGPTLLIEYDRTEADHAHSVWHDPTNLFGEDHLRVHRLTAHASH